MWASDVVSVFYPLAFMRVCVFLAPGLPPPNPFWSFVVGTPSRPPSAFFLFHGVLFGEGARWAWLAAAAAFRMGVVCAWAKVSFLRVAWRIRVVGVWQAAFCEPFVLRPTPCWRGGALLGVESFAAFVACPYNI